MEETEKSYENLENNFINWVEKCLSVKLHYSDIQEVKRVGKKGEKVRPLLVTFSTLGTKIRILKQKSNIKDTQYYVKQDFPRSILEKSKLLQEQLQMEREKGHTAFI